MPDDFIKIDARLKDPDKKAAAIQKWYDKTVFDGGFGNGISIAYAINDQAPKVFYRDTSTTEEDIIINFDTSLHADLAALDTSATPTLVGHHLAFDMGFLFKVYARNRIQFPYFLHWPISYRSPVDDTQTMWCGHKEYISLDTLAWILLGKRKAMRGADVAGLWADGEYEHIAQYNKDDVEMTRAIHKILCGRDYPS